MVPGVPDFRSCSTKVRRGYIGPHEHGTRILGAAAALAADRGLALAAVPAAHRPRRADRRVAAAERHASAVRARPRDLLLRQPVPDRGHSFLARPPPRPT